MAEEVKFVGAEKAGFWRRVAAYLLDGLLIYIVQVILGVSLAGLAGAAYLVFFWSQMDGQSLGARVLGIRVVNVDGSKITIPQAVIRYLGLIVASIPFGIGLIWAAFDKNKQGWQDKIAKTYVVKVAKA